MKLEIFLHFHIFSGLNSRLFVELRIINFFLLVHVAYPQILGTNGLVVVVVVVVVVVRILNFSSFLFFMKDC